MQREYLEFHCIHSFMATISDESAILYVHVYTDNGPLVTVYISMGH